MVAAHAGRRRAAAVRALTGRRSLNSFLIVLVIVAALLALLGLLEVPAKFSLTAASALLLAIVMGLQMTHVH
jgi:small-conductance mechanosensitive channel